MSEVEIPYGPVKVISGKYKSRIAYFDNDDYDEDTDQEVAIVYFAGKDDYYMVPMESISEATSKDLMERKKDLEGSLSVSKLAETKKKTMQEELNMIERFLASE